VVGLVITNLRKVYGFISTMVKSLSDILDYINVHMFLIYAWK